MKMSEEMLQNTTCNLTVSPESLTTRFCITDENMNEDLEIVGLRINLKSNNSPGPQKHENKSDGMLTALKDAKIFGNGKTLLTTTDVKNKRTELKESQSEDANLCKTERAIQTSEHLLEKPVLQFSLAPHFPENKDIEIHIKSTNRNKGQGDTEVFCCSSNEERLYSGENDVFSRTPSTGSQELEGLTPRLIDVAVETDRKSFRTASTETVGFNPRQCKDTVTDKILHRYAYTLTETENQSRSSQTDHPMESSSARDATTQTWQYSDASSTADLHYCVADKANDTRDLKIDKCSGCSATLIKGHCFSMAVGKRWKHGCDCHLHCIKPASGEAAGNSDIKLPPCITAPPNYNFCLPKEMKSGDIPNSKVEYLKSDLDCKGCRVCSYRNKGTKCHASKNSTENLKSLSMFDGRHRLEDYIRDEPDTHLVGRRRESPRSKRKRDLKWKQTIGDTCSEGQKNCDFQDNKLDDESAGNTENRSFPKCKRDDFDSACETVKDHLLNIRPVDEQILEKSTKVVRETWFDVAGRKHSDVKEVRRYLKWFEKFSLDMLKALLHSTDDYGNGVLHYAFANNRYDLVEEFLKNGDTKKLLGKENKSGNSALMVCSVSQAKTDFDWSVIRKSFRMGGVNERSTVRKRTALMYAAALDSHAMVQLLLDLGANPNLQDQDGSTALMYAAEHGSGEAAQVLARHWKCDPAIRDKDSERACSIALRKGYKNVAVVIHMLSQKKMRLRKRPYFTRREIL